MPSYTPLRFAENLKEQGGSFDSVISEFINAGAIAPNTTKDDFRSFVFSPDFFDPGYKGAFSKLNDTILYDHDANQAFIGMSDAELREKGMNRKSEWRDYLGTAPAVDAWCRYKQVYKIDKDFYETLADTDKFEVNESILRHMPFKDFYVDLSEVGTIDDIEGAFVHIEMPDNIPYVFIAIYMISYKLVSFSYYFEAFFGDNKLMITRKHFPNVPYLVRDFDFSKGKAISLTPMKIAGQDHRQDIIVAIFQMIIFVSSKQPDISENPVTKNTYRPSSTIKNKWSEIQMWDVGVRYGAAIKRAKSQAETIIKQEISNASKEKRKPPRPHVRAAHWQTYHVGPGRAEKRLNWVPPTIVCGNTEIPITIHKVE